MQDAPKAVWSISYGISSWTSLNNQSQEPIGQEIHVVSA